MHKYHLWDFIEIGNIRIMKCRRCREVKVR
jgi:hypothetical protein